MVAVNHIKNLNMNIIFSFTEKHVSQLHQFYQKEWWTAGRSLEDTERVLAGSQICIGLVDENNDLMAFARVLTDYVFKAFVFDVIVHPAQRGKGLGDQIMSVIKHHERLKSVRHIELYCLPELTVFYSKHGFSADTGNIQLMRQVKET